MARTAAGLPEGLRLTDHISLGVITKTFPMVKVKEILREHGRAIRGLMHAVATKGDVDSDQLSFVHTVRVIRRKLPRFVAISPSGPRRVPPGRAR